MKRAWIAAAAGALLCVAGLGAWSLESKGAGSFEESQALAAGARASARGGAAMQNQAPVLKVPASARQGAPAVFRLSESMVRAALADGTLLVELPGGIRYPVRMVGWRTPWKGRWTAIGKVATRVGMQSMVLTFGGHDVFGVLPLPDGSQLSIVTSRDVTRIAPAGNLIPPGHLLRSITRSGSILGQAQFLGAGACCRVGGGAQLCANKLHPRNIDCECRHDHTQRQANRDQHEHRATPTNCIRNA